MKRMLALLLALSLLLCACGGDAASVQSAVSAAEETSTENANAENANAAPYYTVVYQEAGAALENASTWDMVWTEPGTVDADGGLLYAVYGASNDTNCRSLQWARPYDEEGTILLSLTGDEAINCFCLGGDGAVYAIVSRVLEDFNGDEHPLDGYADTRMICMDASGTVQWELALDQDGTNSYNSVAVTAGGEIYVIRCRFDEDDGYFSDHYLERYTESGLESSVSAKDAVGKRAVLSDLLTARDGTLLLSVQVSDNPQLYVLDMDGMKEPLFAYSNAMSWPTLYSGGGGADYYILDETGLSGGDLDGETWTCFQLSDLPATVPESACLGAVTGENSFLYYVTVLGTLYFVEITGQWEPVEETEKIQLTVGTSSDIVWATDIASLVVAFNILNPEYNLVLRNYGEDSSLSEEEIRQALNMDILNGEGPDILVLDNSTFQYTTYAGNGYLMDLYPLMDADPEFQRSDYFENIWRAYEQDGALYGVVKNFALDTLVTNGDVIQVPDGWTPTECREIAAQSDIPLGLSLGENVDMSTWNVSLILGDALQGYIDGDTCNFDSGEFAALLELLTAQEPEAVNNAEGVEKAYCTVKNGVYLTGYTSIMSADDCLKLKFFCGDNFAITGYPTPDRAKAIVEVYSAFGIAQTTEYPDAAWSFVKLLLGAEGYWFANWFTTEKSVVEEALIGCSEMAEEKMVSLEMGFGWEEDGAMQSADVTLEPLTQEEVDAFLELIGSLECSLVDEETRQIVQEEAAAYFSGDKTADQVAEIIQNRVQLHLWEIN